MHYINVCLISSKTIPALIIRLFLKNKYNHTSFVLDDNYNEFYSFARKNKYTPFYGGFVKEKAAYYSLGREKDVLIKIYRVPISSKNLKLLKEKLIEIENDKEYIYNLFSACLLFCHKTFETYKAYYCSEFIANILKDYTDVKLDKKPYQYAPYEIGILLNDYLYYDGYISNLTSIKKDNDSFYKHESVFKNFKNSFNNLNLLIKRKI